MVPIGRPFHERVELVVLSRDVDALRRDVQEVLVVATAGEFGLKDARIDRADQEDTPASSTSLACSLESRPHKRKTASIPVLPTPSDRRSRSWADEISANATNSMPPARAALGACR